MASDCDCLLSARQKFGNALAVRRADLGLSQAEIGRRCGRHQEWFSLKERGAREVRLDEMVALAAALECTPHDLLRRAGLLPASMDCPECLRRAAEEQRQRALAASGPDGDGGGDGSVGAGMAGAAGE